jgi:predicted nucleotidyltransferase
MDRETIIAKLKEKLEHLSYVYAMWLEGADACGLVDEFSDLDVWIDVEDEFEHQAFEAAEEALSEIGKIDYNYVMHHGHPKLRQRIYHLKGSSDFLMIDFCMQLHSRNRAEYIYIKDNPVESAKVIFDKDQIIRFKENNPKE